MQDKQLDVEQQRRYVRNTLTDWNIIYDQREFQERLDDLERDAKAHPPGSRLANMLYRQRETEKLERQYALKQARQSYIASNASYTRGYRLVIKGRENKEEWKVLLKFRRRKQTGKSVGPRRKEETVSVSEIITVDEDWMRDNFGDIVVEEEKMRAKRLGKKDDGRFRPLPEKKAVMVLLQKRIVKVKYKPSIETTKIDKNKQQSLQGKHDANAIWKAKKNLMMPLELKMDRNGHLKEEELPSRMPFPKMEDEPWPPRMVVTTQPCWVALAEGGKSTFETDERTVRETFGDRYVEELKRGVDGRGFCVVPVGDYHPSTLRQDHPELCLKEAPKVYYQQVEGVDMCAFKSLASVIHILGWPDYAKDIDQHGADFGKGSTEGFDFLKKVAVSILPSWLQVRKLKKGSSKLDLTPDMIAVVVLQASDGSCTHSVTAHGDYIYDANEEIAIPLCKKGLDYCCSNVETSAQFIAFSRGWIFQYTGHKEQKRKKMSQPHLQRKVFLSN